MKIEDKIKYWEKITEDIGKLKQLQSSVYDQIKDEMMPYKIGELTVCKGKYHRGKRCRIKKYYTSKLELSWRIRVVAECIGDNGEDIGPTDWDHFQDFRLEQVVDLLNQMSPPIDVDVYKEVGPRGS